MGNERISAGGVLGRRAQSSEGTHSSWTSTPGADQPGRALRFSRLGWRDVGLECVLRSQALVFSLVDQGRDTEVGGASSKQVAAGHQQYVTVMGRRRGVRRRGSGQAVFVGQGRREDALRGAESRGLAV